jgi:hypothetical protein
LKHEETRNAALQARVEHLEKRVCLHCPLGFHQQVASHLPLQSGFPQALQSTLCTATHWFVLLSTKPQEQELSSMVGVLERNISCLYTTAKQEIDRKEERILRLQSEVDSLKQRARR